MKLLGGAVVELAGGSETCQKHIDKLLGNQDAYTVCFPPGDEPEFVALIASDGMSGQFTGDTIPNRSFVGSQVLVKVVAKQLLKNAPQILRGKHPEYVVGPDAGDSIFWDQMIRRPTVRKIGEMAEAMGDDIVTNIMEYFAATLLVCMITPWGVGTFAIGDGIHMHDFSLLPQGSLTDSFGRTGKLVAANKIGPFPGNRPPALAYDLVLESTSFRDPALRPYLQFRQVFCAPLAAVTNLGVGVDGIADVISLADKPLPGKEEKVGDLDQFWASEMFEMKTGLQIRLRQMAKAQPKAILHDPDGNPRAILQPNPGLFQDDVTLLTARILQTGATP